MVAATLLLLPLSGCKNACQSLCVEIADFAKRDCGLSFSDADINECIADHAGSSLGDGEAGICRDGRGSVSDEWDCNEIEAYFSNVGSTGGTNQTTGSTDTGA